MRPDEIRSLIRSHQNIIARLNKILKTKPQIAQVRYPSDRIVEEVNKMFNVDVRQKTRIKKVVYARHAAVFLLKNHTNLVCRDIAYSVGNTEHSSVLHSYKVAKDLMDTDPDYLKKIEAIKEKLVDLKD